jgi:hypothetical protein
MQRYKEILKVIRFWTKNLKRGLKIWKIRENFLSLQCQNVCFDYAAECGEQALIDTTPLLNKESLRVALLSFCIAADEGTEEIGVLQAFSCYRYFLLSFGKKGSEILFLQRPRRNQSTNNLF